MAASWQRISVGRAGAHRAPHPQRCCPTRCQTSRSALFICFAVVASLILCKSLCDIYTHFFKRLCCLFNAKSGLAYPHSTYRRTVLTDSRSICIYSLD